MQIFGLTITRAKAAPPVPVYENRGGWWPVVRESFTGAWQRNITVDRQVVLSHHTVYSCITLIAADISKLRVKLVEQDASGIWSEVASPAFSPVLRKPNRYQTRIQFWESWVLSKLTRGNTYVLKERDNRGVVVALYVLDPNRVKPLVADDGSVYYQLSSDNMASIKDDILVPASEVIHDRFNCLFHPLIGTSPIYAAGISATQGLEIQSQSIRLFRNAARPGGVLTAPGTIPQATAERLKAHFEENFTGDNAGRIAVLGDGLDFKKLAMTAVEGQVIEQLKWSSEVVCSTFHMPPYKVGVGPMPTYNNIQSLNIEYYMECLQSLIEAAEVCLDEGLGIGVGVTTDGRILGTEFDVDNLLRMDTVAQYEVLEKAKSVLTLDERRKKVDQKKLPTGGSTVYLQQQDHSIEAIAARDKLLIQQADAPVAIPDNDNSEELQAAYALIEIQKGLA